ncbi:MAG: hypothetical protein IT384_02005 [Deltaproteobacteria bacterium]|nr:hypothetical protein [Deltaproteobacteria bacterium]
MRARRFRWQLLAAVPLLIGGLYFACGDGDSKCPGKICSDCGGSGDCNIPECPAGQVQFCGHFGYWPDDLRKRCTFCEDPSYEP